MIKERGPGPGWETDCPKREDRMHCNCWYDGGRCCACGDDTRTEDELTAHLKTAHNVFKPQDGRECNLCKFEKDSGIIRDPNNGWAIRND